MDTRVAGGYDVEGLRRSLVFEFVDGRRYAVNGYAWSSATGFGRRGPDTGTFSASNGRKSWTQLHRFVPARSAKGPPKNRSQLVRFRFDNPKAYAYCKLDMKGLKGKVALTNIELLQYE